MRKTAATALGLLVCAHVSIASAQQQQPPAPFGGLAPPPPQQQPPSQPGGQPSNGYPAGNSGGARPATSSTATEQQLRKSEDDDSGRGLEFAWLNFEGGFQTLHVGATSGLSSASGGSVGAGLGARFLFFTVGVRGRMGLFSDFKYLTLDPEVGFHIPLGSLEPYVLLGGGYSTLTGFSVPGVSVGGFNVRVGGGLDYYVAPMFSIGAALSLEYVSMSLKTSTGDVSNSTSVGGVAFTGAGVLGVHF